MARRHKICVDLDGVLSSYDKWRGVTHFGDPIAGAKEFLLELSAFADIIIYTTRCNAESNKDSGLTVDELVASVKAWLDKHELKYDEIYSGQGKPLCSAFIDDRNISCRPQEDIDDYHLALLRAKRLCGLVTEEDSK